MMKMEEIVEEKLNKPAGSMSPVRAAGIWKWRHKAKKGTKGNNDLDGEVICDGEEALLKKKPPDCDGEVCSIFESPFRIFKVAVRGNVKDFERVYKKDTSRLHLRDSNNAVPFHHACGAGKLDIMEFILEKGGDLEALDGQGNTALHWAAEKGQATAIDFLILKGISPNMMNHQCMTPLHTACDLDVADSVDALCKHRPLVDINFPGELGQTPLHYCAVRDSVNAARKLLEFTPVLSRPDQNGVYPIHAAATHASAKVMELLFAECGKNGTDRSSLLTVVDKEGNSALHSAVNSGDFAAVKLCLKYGARIDIQQADKSTPVHLASSQGALDMVQLMFSSQDENRKSLRLKDIQNQTPLHKAAMFDHSEVVSYLINEGSDFDAKDRQCRTPLLLATARGAWRAVRTLLQRGADFTQTDCDKRNVLHLALLHGGNLDFFGREFFKKEGALELLNQRDCSGCTPMHYATQQGNIKSVQGLIDLGATVNLKNKEKQSPLHFAARYGRLNSCKRLLDSAIGPHILNESDGAGRTALHIASWSGHVKLVQLLLSKGALLHRDHEGRTPLHLAAVEGYINTMKGLLATHPHLMNQTDDEGNTALHLAARAGQAAVVTFLLDSQAALLRNNSDQSCMEVAIECRNKDVAMAFVMNERWHEAMDDCGDRKAPHMLGLIEQLPEVAFTVLERCQTEKKADEEDPRSRRNYDFTYLRCTKDKQLKFLNSEEGFVPLLVLNTMVKFNRINLLSHPVCVNYLAMKWNAYGRACHVTNITIYLVFVFFLTYFVCVTDVPDSFRADNRTSYENRDDVEEYLRLPYSEFTMSTIVSVWVICGFASMNILKEIVQLLQQKGRYFYEFTNLLEWTLYATSLAFVAPYLAGENKDFQWQCGAIAVFLAWFNFLLYLQRFDIFGIYVVMFLEILRTLVQVLLVFSILIVAFGLTFHILLPREDNHAHNTPAMSLLRVSTALLLGELDFINSFVDPLNDSDNVTMPYPELTYFFLIGLVLLMPILLMNLLIGLAVGDIASMQHNAHLKRLAMQVELHTDLEQKLPARILKAGERDQYTVYTHTAKYFILRARERGKYFFYIKMLQYFIYRIWNKIRETAGMEGNAIGSKMGGDAANDPQLVILQNEMISQKRRLVTSSASSLTDGLKEVKEQLDRQYDLLRLIVQKMEIRSEAEDRDEGEGPGGEHGRWFPSSNYSTDYSQFISSRSSRSSSLASVGGLGTVIRQDSAPTVPTRSSPSSVRASSTWSLPRTRLLSSSESTI